MATVDAVVTGAGGFLGGHLVRTLMGEGRSVRAVDMKPVDDWYQVHETAENLVRVDDCVKGSVLLTRGEFLEPINIGSSEIVTINELVDTAEQIAGITVKREYNLDAPKGVRGRNSDNTLIQKEFGWEPSTRLQDGLELTYRWIYDQVATEFNK
jgi:nucleoside-diphosphate-sugar epimerase